MLKLKHGWRPNRPSQGAQHLQPGQCLPYDLLHLLDFLALGHHPYLQIVHDLCYVFDLSLQAHLQSLCSPDTAPSTQAYSSSADNQMSHQI